MKKLVLACAILLIALPFGSCTPEALPTDQEILATGGEDEDGEKEDPYKP